MNVKDIDLNIGEDFGIVYAVQDDNVDLTGFKSVFAIRKRASGPLVIKVQGGSIWEDCDIQYFRKGYPRNQVLW